MEGDGDFYVFPECIPVLFTSDPCSFPHQEKNCPSNGPLDHPRAGGCAGSQTRCVPGCMVPILGIFPF